MMAERQEWTRTEVKDPRSRWDAIQASKAMVVATWVAMAVPPLIYALYVALFGVNVPVADEWLRVPLVTGALEGHLSTSALWAQFFEYRLPVPNLVFIADGFLAHFNSRSLMFFDAAIFTAGYAAVLVLYRRYSTHRLNPFNVLAIGVVWFSLADVQNSLWGFAVPWYLTVVCFVWMIVALMQPTSRQWLWFGVAVVLAIAASYSMIQGFLLWPMGIICLLWVGPWTRQTAIRVGAWLGLGIVTAGIYSIGFDFGNVGCNGYCSDTFVFSHPGSGAHDLLVLMGNIIPTGYLNNTFATSFSTGWQELVGVIVLVVATGVVVASFRERTARPPLPLLLVVFGFLFDLMIIDGRSSFGPVFMVQNNRYEMPNILIFLGIVTYAIAHVPTVAPPPKHRRASWVASWAGTIVVITFLVAQVVISTNFAIDSGRLSRNVQTTAGRVVVNLDRIPPEERSCALYALVWQGVFTTPQGAGSYSAPIIKDMEDHHFGLYEPGTYAAMRAAGPPIIPVNCNPSVSAPSK